MPINGHKHPVISFHDIEHKRKQDITSKQLEVITKKFM